jgi:hypothetical protein
MKCLVNLIKFLPRTIDTIDLAAILNETHIFLVYHPPSQWKQAADSTPLNVIKSLLSTITKAKKLDIVSHLHSIPLVDGPTPVIINYINQLLQQAGEEGNVLDLLSPKPEPQVSEKKPVTKPRLVRISGS